MNRLILTRRAALTSLALMPLLAACGSNDTTPHVDPSASSYGTLRIGYGALREMRAVAHVYARALRHMEGLKSFLNFFQPRVITPCRLQWRGFYLGKP